MSLQGTVESSPRKIVKTMKGDLLRWICEKNAANCPVDRNLLRDKATNLADELGLNDFKCTEKWLTNFLRKHGFPSTLANASPVFDNYRAWIDLMRSTITRYRYGDLFHVDELTMYSDVPPEVVLDREADFEKHRITILLCCNSSGSERLPLLICGSYKSTLTNADHSYHYERNSWIEESLFKNWIIKLNEKMALNDRKILLLMHRNRIQDLDGLELSNVNVLFFPKGFPPLLRPLRRDVFHYMKMEYRRRYALRTSEGSTKWTVEDVLSTLVDCWNGLPRELVIVSFQRTNFRTDDCFLQIECADWDSLATGVSFRSFVTFDDDLSGERTEDEFSRSRSHGYNLRVHNRGVIQLVDKSDSNQRDSVTLDTTNEDVKGSRERTRESTDRGQGTSARGARVGENDAENTANELKRAYSDVRDTDEDSSTGNSGKRRKLRSDRSGSRSDETTDVGRDRAVLEDAVRSSRESRVDGFGRRTQENDRVGRSKERVGRRDDKVRRQERRSDGAMGSGKGRSARDNENGRHAASIATQRNFRGDRRARDASGGVTLSTDAVERVSSECDHDEGRSSAANHGTTITRLERRNMAGNSSRDVGAEDNSRDEDNRRTHSGAEEASLTRREDEAHSIRVRNERIGTDQGRDPPESNRIEEPTRDEKREPISFENALSWDASRGSSRWMHEDAGREDTLSISRAVSASDVENVLEDMVGSVDRTIGIPLSSSAASAVEHEYVKKLLDRIYGRASEERSVGSSSRSIDPARETLSDRWRDLPGSSGRDERTTRASSSESGSPELCRRDKSESDTDESRVNSSACKRKLSVDARGKGWMSDDEEQPRRKRIRTGADWFERYETDFVFGQSAGVGTTASPNPQYGAGFAMDRTEASRRTQQTQTRTGESEQRSVFTISTGSRSPPFAED